MFGILGTSTGPVIAALAAQLGQAAPASVDAAGSSAPATLIQVRTDENGILQGSPDAVTVIEKVKGRSATRMAVPLREIPATVNVVTRETLEERGTTDFVGALNNVAGVNPMQSYGGFDVVTMRGFQDFVVLDDGIRDERHTIVDSAPMSSMVGVDRIEVVKGPASVLYGMGALGGIINVIKRKPSLDPAYEFSAGAGSYESRRASLGLTGPLVSGPLGRSLLYRLDAGFSSGSDFRGANVDRASTSLAIDFAPTARQRLSLRASYYRNHYDTDAGLPTVADDPTNPDSFRHVPRDLDSSIRYNTPYDRMRFAALSAQGEYWVQFTDHISLTERLSFTDTETEYFSAESLSPPAGGAGSLGREYLFFHHQVKPIANQLELAASFETLVPHTLVAGHDFSFFHWVTPGASLEANSVDLRSPLETQGAPAISPARARVRDQMMNGLFLQDHIAFHDRLKLLVGGRVDFWSRTTRSDAIAPTGATTKGPEQDRSSIAPSYRAGLVFLPTSWLTSYVSYATSFKPVAVMPADGRQLDPETGRQIELGVRLEGWEGRLSANAAAYQINKRDVVIARPMMLYDQAGEQRSRGVELDATLSLGTRARITAGYAYTNAEFVEYEEDGTNYAGKRPSLVPDHTAILWSHVRLLRGLSGGIGGRFMGKSYADPSNKVPMSAYVLADASLSYQLAPATLSLNVYNVLGSNPLTGTGRYYVSSINGSQLTPGSPRTALAQLKLNF